MKIVLVNSLYYPNVQGGAERVLQTLAEALLQLGHEVIVLCTAPEQGVRQANVNGVSVYYVGLKNVYWPFDDRKKPLFKLLWHALDSYNAFMAREVTTILKREQPDVVHTHNVTGFSVSVWGATAGLQVPLVHTLHDYGLICPSTSMFSKGINCDTPCVPCRLYGASRRTSSRLPNAVTGVSDFILARHLRHNLFNTVPIQTVIRNFYAPSRLPRVRTARPDRTLRLGYLGQLKPAKGIERMLETLLGFQNLNWDMQLGGRGPEDYERMIRKRYSSNRIQFRGFVNPEELLNDIDVLVVPSLWHEPAAMVLIEAMANGVPVIGSRRGGTPELILEGVTGITFEPDSPETLESAVHRIASEPTLLESMSEAAIEHGKSFLPSQVVSQYLSIYEKLVDC